jgi:pyruvate,water dikinase
MSLPRILQFHDIKKDDPVGGKARGLARLMDMGLEVPPAFIIVDAKPGEYPAKLEQNYLALGGGKVAVRSSALGEDAEDASFAGQYETILNVEGMPALQKAIDQCLASVQSAGAKAYRNSKTKLGDVPMAIIVQEMVDARCAGVLFTIDPVSSNKQHLVIDAVLGNGDKLVSGKVTPDHYVYDRSKKKLIVRDLSGQKSVLTPDGFRQLVTAAEKAEMSAGEPLDMEWAIDRDGDVCWLQARPITTLSSDLNELDSPLINEKDIFTKCNVSEALPGALCPLTLSVTARALDVGMQQIFVDTGLLTEIDPRNLVFGNFYNHLFINMSTMAWTPRKILGVSAKDLGLAICGRIIPQLDQQVPTDSFKQRRPRLIQYLKLFFSAGKKRKQLEEMITMLDLPQRHTVLEQWQLIDEKLPSLNEAFYIHYVSSMPSGALAPMILGILARGKDKPSDEDHAVVAALLAGAKNVESANIAHGVNEILELLAQQDNIDKRFTNVSAPEAYSYLNSSSDSGQAGKLFRNYLRRHGHRSISEMDIRMKEWASNPMPLIESLQTGLKGINNRKPRAAMAVEAESNEQLIKKQNFVIKLLTRIAHKTIRGREQSKSMLVKVIQKYKVAYRQLAQMMVAEGLLKDTDQIYFFTHKELENYIRNQNPDMLKQADLRKKALPQQQGMNFPEVFQGAAKPVKPDPGKIAADKLVQGQTVSRGHAIGRAVIARNINDAKKLQAGDILIAPITDVAWTPYFSLIAGLATDIGSSVSHGAVVAREYGLPAIVKTNTATQVFKDGDIVVLDANAGHIRLANKKEQASVTIQVKKAKSAAAA